MTAVDIKAIVQRARSAHLVRVLGVYVIVSSAVLQAIDLMTSQFGLPPWFFPLAFALLLMGLPVISATALIQAGTDPCECDDEPTSRSAAATPAAATASDPLKRVFTWRFAIAGGLLTFLALGSLGAGIVWLRAQGRELHHNAVAVMPFHVSGANTDLWHEGLVDLMAAALDATGQFRSSDPRAVLNRWRRASTHANELPEPGKAADIAGALGASHVVLGSLIRIRPDEVRLLADLYSVKWLRKEASAVVEGPEDEITSLVDRLTLDLLRSVWEGDDFPEVRVSAMTTSSIPALRAYLEGEQMFRTSQFGDAQTAFSRAIAEDSTFAIAYYRLAQTYGWFLGLGAAEVPTYLAAAERHSAGLPERDSLLIRGWKLADVDGDVNAIPLFQQLADRYDDDLEVWHGLGDALFHMGSQIGRPPQAAVAPLERTLALDSTFAPALIHLIELAYLTGDAERGRAWTERYLALDSTSMYAQSFRLLTPIAFGLPQDSARAAAALDTASADLLRWTVSRLRGSGSNLALYQMVTLALADPRQPNDARAWGLYLLGRAHLRYGHVAVAVDLFDQATRMAEGRMDEAALFVIASAREVGIASDPASERFIARLAAGLERPFPPLAASGAREGRVDEAFAAVDWLRAHADAMEDSGYKPAARSYRGRALALSGRIAAVRDSADIAIDRLRRGLAGINANWHHIRDIDRYWLANLIEGRDGEEEALSIYGSLYWTPWLEPLGLFHRAELHYRRGELEAAADYYTRFLELWHDADPHLQPRVESARLALERIRGERIAS